MPRLLRVLVGEADHFPALHLSDLGHIDERLIHAFGLGDYRSVALMSRGTRMFLLFVPLILRCDPLLVDILLCDQSASLKLFKRNLGNVFARAPNLTVEASSLNVLKSAGSS